MIKKNVGLGLIIVGVLAIVSCFNTFFVWKYYQHPGVFSLPQTLSCVAILNFIVLLSFLWAFYLIITQSKTKHKVLKFTSLSTVVTLIVGFMVVSNFTIYKDNFVALAYKDINNSILLNNQGQEPHTELYSKFKSDWANNDFEAYKHYEKNISELISISASDALLFNLAESSFKEGDIMMKAQEIRKDGFISQKEFDEFRNKVIDTAPAERLTVIAMRKNLKRNYYENRE